MKKIILENSNKGGHYSPGVISGDKLYISGQLPIDHNTGELIEGGVKEQTLQALKNIAEVTLTAGLKKEDIVHCRIYTPDIKYWDDIDEVYSQFFGDHKPARAVVGTTTLHKSALVVIEAIAEIGDGK